MVFGCQSIENTAKTSVLDRLYGEKRVNYCVFDGKHGKNTVKINVFEGFFVYMFELAASGIGTWKKENSVNSGIFNGLGR